MGPLTVLLLIPVLGALLVLTLPGRFAVLARPVAIGTALTALAFSWVLLGWFDTELAELQFFEQHVWNSRMGTSYSVGVDGFSFPLVLLATLLCLVAILASANIRERAKGYYFSVLLLETAMLGVFMAQDWALFYVFWEFTLVPLFFLIDRWGGARRSMASLNFVLYTMGGSVFMLLSLLTVFDAVGLHSFDMRVIQQGAQELPQATQVLIFLGLLIGFGVKMPIFPLHGWQPLTYVEAPSPISLLLAGILSKMGCYGLLRAAGMLPQAVLSLQDLLAGLALFSLIYGGLLAWRQSDLKRMIAYSSLSHMGVVLLGIAAFNVAGFTGAVTQMVAHGLVAGALFLLIGLLYERTHTRDINDYASLVHLTPRFAFFTIVAFVGAVGLPGTAGFVAELHAIIGGFERWGWQVVLVSVGVLISAAYAVRTISHLFTGPAQQRMHQVKDLRLHELPAAIVLCFAIVALGLMPDPLLKLSAASITALSHLF